MPGVAIVWNQTLLYLSAGLPIEVTLVTNIVEDVSLQINPPTYHMMMMLILVVMLPTLLMLVTLEMILVVMVKIESRKHKKRGRKRLMLTSAGGSRFTLTSELHMGKSYIMYITQYHQWQFITIKSYIQKENKFADSAFSLKGFAEKCINLDCKILRKK